MARAIRTARSRTRSRRPIHGGTDSGDIRKAALIVLAAPFVLSCVAFGAVVVFLSMGEMTPGTLQSGIAMAAYAYVVAGLMLMPAYAVAYTIFFFTSKSAGANPVKCLLWVPLVMVATVWFPSVLFSGQSGVEALKAYLLLAVSSLAVGYIWIAAVRLVLYFWKKV